MRDVSFSLDTVAGIDRARGDLDAALAKYTESLEIRRGLATRLGTRDDLNGLVWGVARISSVLVDLNRFGEAETLLSADESRASELEYVAARDVYILDTCAAFREVQAVLAEKSGDTGALTMSNARAVALRAIIAEITCGSGGFTL
jgi:hypothetical protein